MTLKERIQEDVKAAMRSGDKQRLAALRLVSAAIKQRELDENIQLDDAQVTAVLEKMIKQRREALAQFEAGGRPDLVEQENAEIRLIQQYLPEPLEPQQVEALIAEAIASTGANSIKDMGKVMAQIKSKAAGRVDMSAVSARLKAKLGGP